jgi:hypothetical protein
MKPVLGFDRIVADRIAESIAVKQTARIQESHILIGHILCEIVEEELFNDGHIS